MPTFVPFACLTPINLIPVPQIVVPVPGRNQLIMTQAYLEKDQTETGTITLFDKTGLGWKPTAVMGAANGGHLLDTSVDTDSHGQVNVTVKWPVATAGRDGTYVRLPWTPGKVWTWATAQTYPAAYRNQPKVREAWQGRCTYAAKTYVLYGTPYIAGGARRDVTRPIPGYIEVTEGTKVSRIECAQLGRDNSGNPIDGMLEPEGMALLFNPDGSVDLLVGVATGGPGKRRQWLWTYQIQPGVEAA